MLRWSADGSQLAFAWNASTIRVLDPSAPDGDLIKSSRLLSWIGIAYASLADFTCDAAQGWAPITITKGSTAGQGIVCAGSTQSDRYTPCPSQTKSTCKYTQQTAIGFLRATHTAGGGSYMGLDIGSACNSRAEPVNGAYLGWSNSDGSEVLGSLVCGGHSRFGVFRGKTFTPLPRAAPLPAGTGRSAGRHHRLVAPPSSCPCHEISGNVVARQRPTFLAAGLTFPRPVPRCLGLGARRYVGLRGNDCSHWNQVPVLLRLRPGPDGR